MNNLTPEMQARLDKWRANILPVKGREVLEGKPKERTFDEMEREMDEHERKMWEKTNRGRK
jgi:hypothetical protein